LTSPIQILLPLLVWGVIFFLVYKRIKRRRGRLYSPDKRRSSSTNNIHTDSIEQAGAEGEERVKHQLRYLGQEYRIWNGVILEFDGLSNEFDHIIIGPKGMLHIETKYYSGELRFGPFGIEQTKYDSNGNITEQKNIDDPTGQITMHEMLLERVLQNHGLKDCPLKGILCIAHPKATISGNLANPNILVCKDSMLLHHIKELPDVSSYHEQYYQKLTDIIEKCIRKS